MGDNYDRRISIRDDRFPLKAPYYGLGERLPSDFVAYAKGKQFEIYGEDFPYELRAVQRIKIDELVARLGGSRVKEFGLSFGDLVTLSDSLVMRLQDRFGVSSRSKGKVACQVYQARGEHPDIYLYTGMNDKYHGGHLTSCEFYATKMLWKPFKRVDFDTRVVGYSTCQGTLSSRFAVLKGKVFTTALHSARESALDSFVKNLTSDLLQQLLSIQSKSKTVRYCVLEKDSKRYTATLRLGCILRIGDEMSLSNMCLPRKRGRGHPYFMIPLRLRGTHATEFKNSLLEKEGIAGLTLDGVPLYEGFAIRQYLEGGCAGESLLDVDLLSLGWNTTKRGYSRYTKKGVSVFDHYRPLMTQEEYQVLSAYAGSVDLGTGYSLWETKKEFMVRYHESQQARLDSFLVRGNADRISGKE